MVHNVSNQHVYFMDKEDVYKRQPLSASVTLLEATAPVKLPT